MITYLLTLPAPCGLVLAESINSVNATELNRVGHKNNFNGF